MENLMGSQKEVALEALRCWEDSGSAARGARHQ